MKSHSIPAAALLLGLIACTPPPAPASPASPRYVVRVTSGDVSGLPVDWAIFPEEGWPLEGRRDRTPFQTELPAGRVAAMFRPTDSTVKLEIAILLHQSNGSLKRVSRYNAMPLAVVVVEPTAEEPSVLSEVAPTVVSADR
jgi:hypothetical protein